MSMVCTVLRLGSAPCEKAGNSRVNLLWDVDESGRRGIYVHWADRDRDITYHGPGQVSHLEMLDPLP
jgi:lipoate-protein ligase B